MTNKGIFIYAHSTFTTQGINKTVKQGPQALNAALPNQTNRKATIESKEETPC